jgi:CspA family cold shock protein
MERKRGVVKWFSRLKGYGFIVPEGSDREVFVHYTAIDGEGYRNLFEGDRVEFVEVDLGKGPQARNVSALRLTAVEAERSFFS